MAGQSVERREVLRILALAAGASQFPGFERWVFAHESHHDHADGGPRAPYKPTFFTPDEYATVVLLADLIIPNDGTPGATDAGVAEFIDFMVSSDPTIQMPFRYGITWLDALATRDHGHVFRETADATRIAILERLAYTPKHRSGEEEGQAFFRLVREYTVMGFYTSRIGMQQLDCPSLKEYYAALPGCPHPGNPEHQHLPVPKA